MTKKRVKPEQPNIEHYSDATMSLNASAYLPNMPFVDPLNALIDWSSHMLILSWLKRHST